MRRSRFASMTSGRKSIGSMKDLGANQREYDELSERRHVLVSEHDRLRRKLMFLGGEGS
jgi:hypothetical protein